MEALVSMEHLAVAGARLGIEHTPKVLEVFDEMVAALKDVAREQGIHDLPDLQFEAVGYGSDSRVSKLALAGRAIRLAQALQGIQGSEGGH